MSLNIPKHRTLLVYLSSIFDKNTMEANAYVRESNYIIRLSSVTIEISIFRTNRMVRVYRVCFTTIKCKKYWRFNTTKNTYMLFTLSLDLPPFWSTFSWSEQDSMIPVLRAPPKYVLLVPALWLKSRLASCVHIIKTNVFDMFYYQ